MLRMTVDVELLKISVTMTRDGKSETVVMEKTGLGSWKGTEKAVVTEERLAALFPDASAYDIQDVVDDLFSRGMDMHSELLLDDEST